MKYLKYIFFLFSLLVICSTYAQNNQKITIKYAGKGFKDPATEEGAFTFLRDNTQQVHFIHKGVEMWCDKAIYYEQQDFIEAFSNVIVKQGDTISMSAKYVEYSGETQLAFATGDVILTEPQSTLTTQKLYFDRIKQQAFYNNKGKVVRDSSGTITSKIGLYYMESQKYQFMDDVVLVNPEYTLKTEQLDFYTESGHAYIFGPSTIRGETNKIYCERGFYDTNQDFGYFERNAKIDYDNRRIEGDSMYFNRNRNFASATNNITVTDTINNSIFKGHYAEVHKDQDSVFITKRALAITVQENDSIYMRADTLMVTGPEEKRITRAFYNVRLFKSDLAGKADSVHVDHNTGLTQMINLTRFDTGDAFSAKRRPVLWNLTNQMTGDTIHLLSNVETEKLDSLKVFENAFLISRDTLSKDGYSQIKGKRLLGKFQQNKLKTVDIIKNAEVIYYARNDKDELIAINKSKSGSINVEFIEDYRILTLINQIDGELIPDDQFPDNARKLRGFDWRGDERPNSVDDLFKDDPPLQLPIIKGLEDYKPAEAFFDEDLLNRINQAGKNRAENKSARNIPEISKTPRTSHNLLLQPYDFIDSIWYKNGIMVTEELVDFKKEINVANTIIGTGKADGHIAQAIKNTSGTFKFSVWLKGKGTINIRLQQVGDDYTPYKTLDIALTKEWKQYIITETKEDDGSAIRCIISNIQIGDDFYVYDPQLVEVYN